MASTYPLSRPVLAELRNRRAASGLPYRPPTNEGNNYVDQSLAQLGDEVLSQKKELDTAFSQQFAFVRDADFNTRAELIRVTDKITDLDRTFSKCFHDLDDKIDRVETRLSDRIEQVETRLGDRIDRVENSLHEVRASNARLHNATKFRLHQSIERVPYVKDGVIRWADEKIYPSTVKSFWQLGHKQGKRVDLLHLLLTYGEKTIRIPLSDAPLEHSSNEEEEDEGEHEQEDEDENEEKEEKALDTFQAVRQNQMACLKVLATHLGLDFVQIEEQVRKHAKYGQRDMSSRSGVRFRDQHDDPGSSRAQARVRTQAQVSNPGAESPIEIQVRASQEHNSGTSITSSGSNVSGLRRGPRQSSSPNDVSDSYATQPLSRDSDDDSG